MNFIKQICLLISAIFTLILFSSCDNNLDTNVDVTVSNIEKIVTETEESEDMDILYSELPTIVEEISKFSDGDVIDVLYDKKISDMTKQIIIEQLAQINNGAGIKDQTSFMKILEDKQFEDLHRIHIMNALTFNSEKDIEILKNIVLTENNTVTMNAMRKILKISPKTTLKISNEIIDNFSNFGEYQIKSAIMMKSDYLRDASINSFESISLSEIDGFISFCIYQFNESSEETFKNAMIFSLMDINHIRAVKAIISNSDVSDLLKKECVIRNYQTFSKVLDKEFSKEDVDCIILAMEIFPIKEVGILLQDRVLSDSCYSHSELTEIVDKINNNGSDANMKWVVTKPKYMWE